MKNVKRLVLQSNGRFVLEASALPPPGDDEFSVEVKSAGVCSTDIPRAFANGSYTYPLVLGHEFSGYVSAMNGEPSCLPGITTDGRSAIFPLKPCFCCESCNLEQYQRCKQYSYYGSREDGGFCEALTVKKWNVLFAPKTISFEDLALVEPLSVVVHAAAMVCDTNLNLADGQIGIFGSGFLGLMMVDVLTDSGVHNIKVFDRNLFKLEKLKQVNVEKHHFSDFVELRETNRKHLNGLDVVIEMTGSPDALEAAILMCKHGGLIILVGNPFSDTSLSKDFYSLILRKELSIKGSWNSSFKNANRDDWLLSMELLNSGYKPSQYVSHRSSLDNSHLLLEGIASKRTKPEFSNFIKGLINVSKNKSCNTVL